MATKDQIELFEAIRTHTSALETERDAASGLARQALDFRLEDARSLLEWLSTILQPAHVFFQVAEMTTLSSVAVEAGQGPLTTFARSPQSVRR
jgi:hypothetical protein